MPGHPEGADRTIRFSFSKGDNGKMNLVVHARGPASMGSLLGPLNSQTVARASWTIFQHNLNSRLP